jgi:hypothetical protein
MTHGVGNVKKKSYVFTPLFLSEPIRLFCGNVRVRETVFDRHWRTGYWLIWNVCTLFWTPPLPVQVTSLHGFIFQETGNLIYAFPIIFSRPINFRRCNTFSHEALRLGVGSSSWKQLRGSEIMSQVISSAVVSILKLVSPSILVLVVVPRVSLVCIVCLVTVAAVFHDR